MAPTLVATPPGVGKLLGDEIAHLLRKHSGLLHGEASRVADLVLEQLEHSAYTLPACHHCGSFEVDRYEEFGAEVETGPWDEQGWVCRCGWRDASCAQVVVLAEVAHA